MNNREILIRTEKLCKSFSEGKSQEHILKNLDVLLYKNDFTVIMGASGSGTTTLLYMLSGMDIFMTMEGWERIYRNPQWASIWIYLDEETNTYNFIQEVKRSYGNQISHIEDFQKLFNQQFHSTVANTRIMVLSILIIAIAIVLSIVVLLTKSIFLDYRYRFGIMKAIGFTSGQIIKQVATSCLPVVAIGGLLGYLLTLLFTDNIILMLFQGMGVYKINFVIPTTYISGFIFGICFLSYVVSTLSAYRIKENSPVELIRER